MAICSLSFQTRSGLSTQEEGLNQIQKFERNLPVCHPNTRSNKFIGSSRTKTIVSKIESQISKFQDKAIMKSLEGTFTQDIKLISSCADKYHLNDFSPDNSHIIESI